MTAGLPTRNNISIGTRRALVTETREAVFQEGEQEMLFTDLVSSADLSSLMVSMQRVPVKCRSWKRSPGGENRRDPSALSRRGTSMVWEPSADKREASLPQDTLDLLCTLYAPLAGRRRIELTYAFTGLTWRTSYKLSVRGWNAPDDRGLSVEFWGNLMIQNDTHHIFDNAQVTLTGEETDPDKAASAPGHPGFLMLDPVSPLADLWRPAAPDRGPHYTYRIPGRVDLPLASETRIPLVRVDRVPASRMYRLETEIFPLAGDPEGHPLQEYVVFSLPAAASTVALPPGPVDLFPRGLRPQLMREAYIPYTPAGEELRVEMGRSPLVRGSQQQTGRSEVLDQSYVAHYEIKLINRRPSPVRVDIIAKPRTELKWDVVSINESYVERDNRLEITTKVEPESAHIIHYRVRIHEPEM